MKISAATLSLLTLDEYTYRSGHSGTFSRAQFYDLVHADVESFRTGFLEQCRKAGELELLEKYVGQIFSGKGQSEAKKILGPETFTVFRALARSADGVISIFDDEFPLVELPEAAAQDKPFLLFYRGDLSLLDMVEKNIAIVGLLKPEEETLQRINALVPRLVARGANIVSGLARGCDQAAHEACLRAGGRTIAILPSPLHRIYPRENARLAREIANGGGLLLSEYYRDVAESWEFSNRATNRDRLQAMFSCCVILAASHDHEAGKTGSGSKSPTRQGGDCGSRHAMEKARSYKRRRAILYDESADSEKPWLGLNRHYFDFNQRLFVRDVSFFVMADPANDDLEKLLGAGENIAAGNLAPKMAKTGESAVPDISESDAEAPLEDEESADDFYSQIPLEVEEEPGVQFDADEIVDVCFNAYEDASQEEYGDLDASQEYEEVPGPDAEDNFAGTVAKWPVNGGTSRRAASCAAISGIEAQKDLPLPRAESGEAREQASAKIGTSAQSLLIPGGLPTKAENRKKRKPAPAAPHQATGKDAKTANPGPEKSRKGKKRAQIREDQFRLF